MMLFSHFSKVGKKMKLSQKIPKINKGFRTEFSVFIPFINFLNIYTLLHFKYTQKSIDGKNELISQSKL